MCAALTRDHALALAAVDRAVMISPNAALVLGFDALTRCLCGAYDKAIEHAEKAIHLGPLEPLVYHATFALALAYLLTDRFEEAAAQARKAIEGNRNFALPYCVLALGCARLGHRQEAAEAVRRLIDAAPGFRIGTLRKVRFADPASLQSHLAGAERAFSLLDEAPDVIERPDARPIERALGAVAFRNVSFAYGNDPPVLRDISFDVPSGTRVGIAGTTGAGKTTLVSLLTRFYDPTAGEVTLDGVDLRDYKLAGLRNQYAIVLQEPVLFSTSVAENIAYARSGADMTDIVEAARAANAHEFIVNLPEGYETKVGERGMRLSGGERQRIALARAFLKDAPVLILDEPTSSVDVATEELIMEAMKRLMSGRTTILPAPSI